MVYKFGDASLRNMEGVHSQLVTIFRVALSVSPIDFGIPETGGLRTAEEQNDLYKRDKSKADGFVNRSKHQDGLALDFFAYVNGEASWLEQHLSMVAGVILSTAKRLYDAGIISIKVRWGGTFGSDEFDGWDMPHIEIV